VVLPRRVPLGLSSPARLHGDSGLLGKHLRLEL